MTVPLPQGFTVRPPTMDDIPIIVDLITTTNLHDIGESRLTAEELANQFAMPGINMEDVSWGVFNSDGDLVAVGLALGFPPYVQVYSLIAVHPDYRESHLIDYLMQRIFTQAETYIPQSPANAQVTITSGIDGRNQWTQGVLSDFGFSKVRGFFEMQIDMDTPPPEPQFPSGIRLRPFDPETQIHDVYTAVDEAFEDHYGHVEGHQTGDEEFQRWWHNISRNGDYDPTLFFVAVDGDEIAGISLCQPDVPTKPDIGYVSILGVRRAWRGKGLAKALLHHTFGEFYRRGTFKVALGVDAENLTGATKLYEKVGMRVVRESFVYSKCLREGVNLVKDSL